MTNARVPAADQTLRILSLLARSRGPMLASMIASRLDLPRSTVYHLLATMQAHGYVLHLPEERRYGLGIAAAELSLAYVRHEPLTQLGRPLVAALVDRLGLSGHLAIAHDRDVIYLVEERATGAPSLVSDVDVRLPMQLTATGRAMLAAYPRAHVRALFPNAESLAHRLHDPDDIDRPSKLRAVLEHTRTRGFAVERDSITPGLWSVGVPVLDHRGWPVAAIAITFPAGRVAEAELPELADAISDTARTLATRIHGRARPDPERW